MASMRSVTRKVTSAAADVLLDPLSLFAQKVEEEEPIEEPPPAPVVTKSTTNSTKSTKLGENSSFSPQSTKDQSDYVNVQRPTRENNDTSSDLAFPNFSKRESNAASNIAINRSTSPIPARRTTTTTSSGKYSKESEQSPTPQPEAVDNFQFMTGESKVMNMNDSTIQLIPSMRNIQGVLYMTNYRIVFIPSAQDFKNISATNPSLISWLQLPLGCIDKVERSKDSQPLNGICIVLSCKDCRQWKITIRKSYSASSDYEVERAYNLIYTYVFPNNLKHIFAFNHKLPSTSIPIDLLHEYSRLGILDSNYWRVTTANHDFKLCNTYSETLIVPRSVSDEELFAVAAFRSGCRLPALSWGDANNGATLWRSAQPKCGMSGSCKQDERLLDVIAQSAAYFQRKNPNSSVRHRETILYIVDCRSRASAMANRAAGAGYESQTNYVSSRLEFYNIPNIHAVRESLRGITSVMLNPSANPTSDINFSKQIEDSQWLLNARLIIKASHETATQIHRGIPVLVHCSHGWDRTAQVCMISQLFLDPFYRTMDGFAVLVEKEWCSFGHPFFMRCGHGHEKGQRSEDDISPIFLQCLDCVWQIVKQFPAYFEFNTRYLLTLADHIYSCRFGTFLFSSDQQRKSHMAKKYCTDIWTFFNLDRTPFLNPFYHAHHSHSTEPGSPPSTSSSDPHLLFLPPLGQILRGVSLWGDYFLRWSTVASVPPIPSSLSNVMYHPISVTKDPYDGTDLHSRIVQVLSEFPEIRAADCILPPLVQSTDTWEAMYTQEKHAKEHVDEKIVTIQNKAQDVNNILLEFIQNKFLKNTTSDNNTAEYKREFEELMNKLAQEKGLGVENINGTYTVTTAGFKECVGKIISSDNAAQPTATGEGGEPVTDDTGANDVDDLLPYYNDKENENAEDDLMNKLTSAASDPNFLEEIGTAEADREIIVVDSSTLAPQPPSERQSSTVMDDETFAILV